MKVIILAGGFGTRLSEYTHLIPKPMVQIGGRPIIWHIMQRYAYFGHKEFLIALGYKAEIIKDYFLKYRPLNSDFEIDLSNGNIKYLSIEKIDWKVTLVDTGLKTMTGGRIKRLKNFIGNESFLMTYGDGVADINIEDLIKFHEDHGKLATLCAVRPPARFGDLQFDGANVVSFKEKTQINEGWINGGFFVCKPQVLDFIEGDQQMFEREPMESLVKSGQLMAYKHHGFWQCMDTKRDHERLEDLWKKSAPWL